MFKIGDKVSIQSPDRQDRYFKGEVASEEQPNRAYKVLCVSILKSVYYEVGKTYDINKYFICLDMPAETKKESCTCPVSNFMYGTGCTCGAIAKYQADF